jgi:hypothetical protein
VKSASQLLLETHGFIGQRAQKVGKSTIHKYSLFARLNGRLVDIAGMSIVDSDHGATQ